MAWSPDHSSRWSKKLDHAGVGPLQVLDDHDDGQVLGEALEEQAPAREELFSREHLGGRQPEQLAEAGGDELPVGGVRDPALEARSAAARRRRPGGPPR